MALIKGYMIIKLLWLKFYSLSFTLLITYTLFCGDKFSIGIQGCLVGREKGWEVGGVIICVFYICPQAGSSTV